MWAIWASTPELAKELKSELYEKIDSKMKLAGILGGLITAILVFLLKSLIDLNPPIKLDNVLHGALFV